MTKDAQTVAIQEAFGYNLQILESQLAGSGQSLERFHRSDRELHPERPDGDRRTDPDRVFSPLRICVVPGGRHRYLQGRCGPAQMNTARPSLQYIDQFGGY